MAFSDDPTKKILNKLNEIDYTASETRYIEPKDIRVGRDPLNAMPRLEIANEQCSVCVSFIRAFPFSEPERYIVVMDGDDKEIGILESLSGIDDKSYEIIQEELDRRYFTPRVFAIYVNRKEGDVWRLEVSTDRGNRVYYVEHWHDKSHEISSGRWLIEATDGTRLEIPNINSLDKRSRSLIEQTL